jgi:RNA polymerase-binding transcription factor DksA
VADQTLSDAARSDLLAERDRLAAQIEALEPGRNDTPVDDNFADSGQVAAEQGENQALAAPLKHELEEVDHALAKIDEGTYGLCETCGEAIAPARLEAKPAARFCIDHA